MPEAHTVAPVEMTFDQAIMIKVEDGNHTGEDPNSMVSKKDLQTLIMKMKKNAEVEKDI
jgi:hypothetical protein